MNEKDKWIRRKGLKGLFKPGVHENAVTIAAPESLEHFLLKAKTCYELRKQGHVFITEAEFKGGRADVVDLTEGEVFEIVVSESEESLARKGQAYPLPVTIVRA